MATTTYVRRRRRNRRRGIDQVRAVHGGDIEARCVCGAPTVALGLCVTLRPHGQPFENYVVLCAAHVALAQEEGMEIVWLAGAAPAQPT